MNVYTTGHFLKLCSWLEGSNTALPSSKQDAWQPSVYNLTWVYILLMSIGRTDKHSLLFPQINVLDLFKQE
jgi:hypothetical protein